MTEWNCMESHWAYGFGPEMYPGDDVVDVVGLDMYRRYTRMPNITAMQNHRDFAIQHNKKLGYSEWGFGSGIPGVDEQEFLDDPSFVDAMANFFESLGSRLAYQVCCSHRTTSTTFPSDRCRWLVGSAVSVLVKATHPPLLR